MLRGILLFMVNPEEQEKRANIETHKTLDGKD